MSSVKVDFDEALRGLINAKANDGDIVFLTEKLDLITEAYTSGVGVAGIWRVLKNVGFKGGKEKLTRFLEEKGVKKKSKSKVSERQKKNIGIENRSEKKSGVNASVANVQSMVSGNECSDSGEFQVNEDDNV